jgi:uncharacterized protein YmfQ (DUF2313 family)
MSDRHVRRSGSDYVEAFLALLPQGNAWPRQSNSVFVKACTGLSNYWGFVDSRIADLLELESDPRKTVELLPDWERNWGLPDPCFKEVTTVPQRQEVLVAKMTLLGAQSRQFFTWVAGVWEGVTIHIVEYSPFMVGVSQVGDTRTPPLDPNPLIGEYRWYLGPPEMRFYWSINSDEAVLKWFRCGYGGGQTGVDPHLRIITESPIDCLLDRWKPAHTQIVFDYSAAAGTGGPMAGTP